MYTLPKDTKITNDILNKAIEYNEQFTKRYNELEEYYLGKHKISNRVKENTDINNKIVVNHAKYITDTNVGYLLGNPVDYQPSEEYDIQPLLDAYKKQTINDLDTEIAKDISMVFKENMYMLMKIVSLNHVKLITETVFLFMMIQ